MSIFAKDESLDRIISGLTRIKCEVIVRNIINLCDIDIIAEDFFTGLLNLIYGYELKNANHIKKNYKTIDLYDRKNRITVQVTANNNCKKIQETIDGYYKNKFYNNYDRLVFLVLRDKKDYQKKFNIHEPLCFDVKRDILDITNLIEKIHTLNTEKIIEIDKYLEVEIVGYKQTDNIQHEKKNKKKILLFSILGALFIAIFTCVSILQHLRIANVYASNIYPYTQAGSYNSFEEFPTLYKDEIETNKAFAIMSNFRSNGEKVSSIEQQYCEILSLDPIEKAVIKLDAVITDNELYLFAFNDGWGKTETPIVKSAALMGKDIDITIEEVSKNIDYGENTEIKSAGGVLLAKYVLDSELLKQYYEKHEIQLLNLNIKAEGKDYSAEFNAYLEFAEDRFCLKYDGIGAEGYSIQLFAVLDVDQNPSAIHFTGKNATPFIEDNLNIETVLAPTKSCTVKCRNVFSVNGKRQQTDIYTATVNVPVFNDTAIFNSGLLTQELAQLKKTDEALINTVIQKYLYNPESIEKDADNY